MLGAVGWGGGEGARGERGKVKCGGEGNGIDFAQIRVCNLIVERNTPSIFEGFDIDLSGSPSQSSGYPYDRLSLLPYFKIR